LGFLGRKFARNSKNSQIGVGKRLKDMWEKNHFHEKTSGTENIPGNL